MFGLSIYEIKRICHPRSIFHNLTWKFSAFYEGCLNMNASSFITFFIYMLHQNGKRFYKGFYVTFELVPNQKKNTVYLSSYSPLNEGHVSILTNSVIYHIPVI